MREREGEGYDGRATRERNKRPLSIVCLGEVEQRTPIREGGRKQERGGGVQGFRIKSRESLTLPRRLQLDPIRWEAMRGLDLVRLKT